MHYRIEVHATQRTYDGRHVYRISFWVKYASHETSLLIHTPCGQLVRPEDIPQNVILPCKRCGQPMDDATLSPYVALKETKDVVAERLARYVGTFVDKGQEVELYIYYSAEDPTKWERLTSFERQKAAEEHRLRKGDIKGLYPWERLKKDMETRDLLSLMKMFLG